MRGESSVSHVPPECGVRDVGGRGRDHGTPAVRGRPHIPQYVPPPPPAPYHPPQQKEEPKPYAFDYGVKDTYSGAQYAHAENSDGQEVTGSYSVALPDGRIQTVHYVADHLNGFQARVTYEGEAKYPDIPEAPASYHPAPVYQPRPQPPVYLPAPPAYLSGKEEEQQVEQQVVYEPVEASDAIYRDQVEEYV
ncbi:cuticle protein 7-like [Scylla paramamosain]|uniref:cuticle protein 7-like n=1 Tax=Scylla paramamosain TaxID=85552 RepID=UPI0030829E7E